MKKYAMHFYKDGYNCSACILKAAEKKYNLTISRQCYNMCNGVNTGFGIGGMCSVLIACVMIFGLLFDQATVKRLRIKLLADFSEKYGSMNCDVLKKRRGSGEQCEELIGAIAEMAEKLIDEERQH